jgi:hypothetical protein
VHWQVRAFVNHILQINTIVLLHPLVHIVLESYVGINSEGLSLKLSPILFIKLLKLRKHNFYMCMLLKM